ncbi:hypothetical protein Nm8I071_26840 [Nonomuraea sp. TT08I-71]|nr:hypothetical protein Nm8I071_26840 [Nonomuraea sp. TT08I-71]
MTVQAGAFPHRPKWTTGRRAADTLALGAGIRLALALLVLRSRTPGRAGGGAALRLRGRLRRLSLAENYVGLPEV